MADYREISQEYARAAINASILLNGGAAVALISQFGSLVSAGFGPLIFWPLLLWALGALLAGATYPIAFQSTRYVDKSEREKSEEDDHLTRSDCLMKIGFLANALSLMAFGAACGILAYEFKTLFG